MKVAQGLGYPSFLTPCVDTLVCSPESFLFLASSLRLALSLSIAALMLYVTLLPIVAPEILEASYPQGNILMRTGAILGLLAVPHCSG